MGELMGESDTQNINKDLIPPTKLKKRFFKMWDCEKRFFKVWDCEKRLFKM